jgi:hypothetical protein
MPGVGFECGIDLEGEYKSAIDPVQAQLEAWSCFKVGGIHGGATYCKKPNSIDRKLVIFSVAHDCSDLYFSVLKERDSSVKDGCGVLEDVGS